MGARSDQLHRALFRTGYDVFDRDPGGDCDEREWNRDKCAVRGHQHDARKLERNGIGDTMSRFMNFFLWFGCQLWRRLRAGATAADVPGLSAFSVILLLTSICFATTPTVPLPF